MGRDAGPGAMAEGRSVVRRVLELQARLGSAQQPAEVPAPRPRWL